MKLIAFLVFFALLIGFSYSYASFARSIIDSGSWFWLAMLFVAPFVLGYIVGNSEDRAEYHRVGHKFMGWLRLR